MYVLVDGGYSGGFSGESADGSMKTENTYSNTLQSTSCFQLNQRDAKLICRACNESYRLNITSPITWCIEVTKRRTCGTNTTVFRKKSFPEVVIASDGNMLLKNARGPHASMKFTCTRMCHDGQQGDHTIKVLLPSMYLKICMLQTLMTMW